MGRLSGSKWTLRLAAAMVFVMPAPAAVYADFFARTDSTTSLRSSYWTAVKGQFGVTSEAFYSTISSDSMAYQTQTTGLSADQWVQAKIAAISGSSGCTNYRGITARTQIATNSWYQVIVCDPNGNLIRLQRVDNNVVTNLVNAASGAGAAGDVLRMEVSGSGATVTFTLHHYDSAGNEKANSPTVFNDSSASRITAAGPAGIVGRTSSSGLLIDNWYAGNASDVKPPVVMTAAQEVYVSPSATYQGTGTFANPYRLDVLLAAVSVPAGTTVWLRGGTYTPDKQLYDPGQIYKFAMSGTASAYTKFKAYPGEIPTLDPAISCMGYAGQNIISADGSYLEFNGLHVTNSDTSCQTLSSCGSNPSATPFRSIRQNGAYTRIIDLVLHDTGEGITSQQVTGLTAIGNIVFNNGWNAPDRLHGHGRYYQNNNCSVNKLNKFNFLFRNASTQTKWFSQSGADTCNFTHESEVMFKGGLVLGTEASGGNPNDFTFDNNYLYQMGLNWNLDNNLASNVKIRNNHLDGGFTINRTNGAVITGNRFMNSLFGGTGGISFSTTLYAAPYDTPAAAFAAFDNNTYWATASSGNSFAYNGALKTFAQWQAIGAGMDAHSGYNAPNSAYPSIGAPAPGSTDFIYVTPHPEKAGIGSVAVYNYTRTNTKSINLSTVFNVGDPYEIIDVQNWEAGPLATGSYGGGSVSFDTSAKATYQAPKGPLDSTPWQYPYACPYGGASGSDASSVTRIQLQSDETLKYAIVVQGGVMTVTVNGTHGLVHPAAVSITGATSDARFNALYTTLSVPNAFTWTATAPSGVPDGSYDENSAFSEEGIFSAHSSPGYAHTGQDFDVFLVRRRQVYRTPTSVNAKAPANAATMVVDWGYKTADGTVVYDGPQQRISCAGGAVCAVSVPQSIGDAYYRLTHLAVDGSVVSEGTALRLSAR